MNTAKSLLVADFSASGHHPLWLREILAVVHEARHRLTLIFPERERVMHLLGSGAQELLEDVPWIEPAQALTATTTGRLARLRQTAARWKYVGQMAREHKASRIFFPMLDQMQETGLPPRWATRLCSVPWTGIWLFPRQFRQFPGRPLPFTQGWVLKTRFCQGLGLLDTGVAKAVEIRLGKPTISVPDFAETAIADPLCLPWVKRLLERIPHNAFIVLLAGDLSPRKGLARFLTTAEEARTSDLPLHFLMSGRIKWAALPDDLAVRLRQAISTPPDNLLIHDEFIPDEVHFNALVKAAGALYCVYDDFPHSSNQLARAAATGTPLIAPPGGYMAEQAREFKLGVVAKNGHPVSALAGLRELLRTAATASPPTDYLRHLTREGFRQSIRQLVLPA